MATLTDKDYNDPRIREIEETQAYGLFYEGELLYIGSTARPLERRLSEHKKEASRRDTRLYNRLEELKLGKVTIHSLPYDSEQEALEALWDDVLNAHEKPKAEYEGPGWTPGMVDILEDADTDEEAARRLDVPYHVAYDARKKLGVGEAQRDLPDELVRSVWALYHLLDDVTCESVAESVSESSGRDISRHQVSRIIRRETYEHVDVPSKAAIKAEETCQDDIVREEPAVGTIRMRARS